jgi:hypothetical protein
MEDYKFVGFSTDISLFEEAELYWTNLITEVLAVCPDKEGWEKIEYMSGDNKGEPEVALRRRFELAMGVATIGFRNLSARRGIRIQQQDPLGEDGRELSASLGARFEMRPAFLMGWLDSFGDPDTDRDYTWDMVVCCELSSRTAAVATGLIHKYTCENLGREEMRQLLCAMSDEEEKRRQGLRGDR